MAQYKTPLLHSSQDMMQELFEEINDYLGDKDKPVLAPPTPPVLSTFNVSTEGEEDEHSLENTQINNNTMVDHDDVLYQVETPLQPAMFVESDEEDSFTEHDDTRNSIHIEGEQTVCMCYKCKNDEAEYPGQQQPNTNTNYDKSSSAGSQLFPFKRRSKPTPSFGGAVGNAKLAHIAGLVKHTLTSTPRDILPTTVSTQERPTNSRHQSALSASSISDKLISPFTSLMASSSTPSSHSYNSYKADDAYSLSLVSSNKNNPHSQNDTFSSHDSKPGASYDGKFDYQDKNGNWMMMAAATPGDLTTSMDWDTTTSQDTQHQSEPSPYKEQDTANTTQTAVTATPVYLDSYLEEKQQLQDDFSLTQQLPFLTPAHRIGEPHSIVLRTKLARDVGSHEDRINAYNNAYSHCIMARTDMVPWIKKQYSKGPPNLVLQYTPRPKKSSKSLLGLFKRHSKLDDTLPSTPLSAYYNSNQSKLSVSSAQSSVLTDQPTAVSPQPSFTPSESYFPQEHQQPQQQHLSDATSFLLPTPSPSNEEHLHLSLAGNTSSKINKNTSNHTPHEHHRRSPSPSHPIATGKKKSKSFASVTEPVSILKKSSSMATVADGSGKSILKKSPSTTSFGDDGHSPGYRNKPSTTLFGGAPEDGFSNLKKSRSPSPNPSVESRRPSSRHRSPSPISYISTAPNSNNNHSKLSQLLCPPTNRSQTRQRSRSVSPSPRPSSSSRSRSLSPMAPPVRRSSLLEEYSESPRHYRHHFASDYQRSPSPSRSISNRQYITPPKRHLSPRRCTNDNNKSHQRSNSQTSPSGGYHHSEKMERKVHRTRSSEHYDHYSSRYIPPIDIPDDDSAIMVTDRRSRRSSRRSPSPLRYDEESNYLLPLEHQHLPRRVSSRRRLRSASPNHSPPLLAATGRRATDPSNTNLRHSDRATPVHRRRSMVMEEEQDPSGHYYYEGNGYSPQRQTSRNTNPSKRRPSSIVTTNSVPYQPPPPPPLGKQQQSMSAAQYQNALHDLCAFFQHLPKHVLANYLQDAGGDFFLAKDLCMEDIMANGI